MSDAHFDPLVHVAQDDHPDQIAQARAEAGRAIRDIGHALVGHHVPVELLGQLLGAGEQGVGVARQGLGIVRILPVRLGEQAALLDGELPRLREGRLEREPHLPERMEGGPDNPLGRHALRLAMPGYLIHGTNQPNTIGQALSSGCIRMLNDEVIDLYDRVDIDTPVVVL